MDSAPRRGSLAGVLSIALALAGCREAPKPAAPPTEGSLGAGAAVPTIDYRQIAARLVTQSLRARTGELILVNGSPRDLELMEDLAVELRRQAAWPLLAVTTERLVRMQYTDVPPERDVDRPETDLALAKILGGSISIDVGESNDLLAGVPATRFHARSVASQPVYDAIRKLSSRQVYLGNGMYPTEANAAQAGMTQAELAQMFWDGINVDYGQLQARGLALSQRLAAGRQVHLTNPNGTDVRFSIAGRVPAVSDGVISDDDVRKGFATRNVYLPAGEVYVTIVPGSAEGTIHSSQYFLEGRPITNLVLEIHQGKVTSLSAERGIERLKELYDAAGPGADQLSILDLGINPNVRPPAGSRFQGWVPAGTVTLSIGSDTWAGGSNSVGFGLPVFLPGSTLTLDEQNLVENGQLVANLALADR